MSCVSQKLSSRLARRRRDSLGGIVYEFLRVGKREEIFCEEDGELGLKYLPRARSPNGFTVSCNT